MPIQIVQRDERLVYESDGSKIFYRRIPIRQQNLIVKKYTKRGKTNWAEVTKEFLDYMILDWDDVEVDGKAVNFDRGLLTQLPPDVVNDLLDRSGAANKEEDAGKNFEIISPSKSSTKQPV